MKALLTIALLLSTATAGASDRLENEIICNEIMESGQADNGVTLILQSNPTAWMKNVAIYENGWAGPRHIANISVPLLPSVRGGSGYIPEDILTYFGSGLILEIRTLRIEGRPLNGGHVELTLPGHEKETMVVSCEYVK